MRIRAETLKTVSHPPVWNRLARLRLDCSCCPPNQFENKKTHKKHGIKKKRKQWKI